MKKIIFSVFIFSFLVPVFAFASFDISLKYGSHGDAVIELQDFLQDQGMFSGKVDGRFGLGTRKAVIAFQLSNGLKGDGYFGLGSRTKANSILVAELKPSTDAEQAQTGTITPPISGNGCTSTSGFSITTGIPCNVATPTVSNTNVQQQISQIQTSLNQIVQNTAPIVQPPSAVNLTVTAPGKYGKSIIINPDEDISVNINVNNPNNNNLNPGYSCIKSGDWQGPTNPVDHNETKAQDSNLDFSKIITGGTKTFGVTCSNSAGSRSDSVTVNIQPVPVIPIKVPSQIVIKPSYTSVYYTENLNTINDSLQRSVDYTVYLVDKDNGNYPEFAQIPISVDAPDSDRMAVYILKSSTSLYGIDGFSFHYTPRTKGTQTIKFTAGNISASTTLEVK